MRKPHRLLRNLLAVTTLLALVTIVFGAYVRLTDAGLGCPDWPGCYGRLVVPESASALAADDPNLTARPLEVGKAWREMIHRYLASTLGLLIIAAVGLHLKQVREGAAVEPTMLLLLPLVLFQGVLGMWTVTLLLKPLVVMAHLLGGMTILCLLVWNLLRTHAPPPRHGGFPARFVKLALAVVFCQVALGGWTSTNYAALACADFPTCHGTYWPEMDFQQGFRPWHGLGIDYEFGILDAPARIAIHYTHRIGALVTTLVVGVLACVLLGSGAAALRRLGGALALVLGTQLTLGILNVVWQLPLPVAVAHNLGAAGLLVTLTACLYHASLTVRSPRAAAAAARGLAAG